MKTCTKCGEMKSLSDFPTRDRKYSRDGRGSNCFPCKREIDREASRRYRAKNGDKARAATRAWRNKHPDYHRKWYKANIDRERKRGRDGMARSRKAKPELEIARKRRYRASNLETVRIRERENTQRRRALKGSYSRQLADLMARLVEQPCAYCGSTTNVTIDHVVPLSRGGKHEASNLAPACYPCNCSKSDLLLSEWNGRAANSYL